jgi:hypothetical protein
MHGADREVVEHSTVLFDAGAVTRVIGDRSRLVTSQYRCARSVYVQAFVRCCGRGPGPQPNELCPQLHGVSARRCLNLDLILGELSGDQIAEACGRPSKNPCAGWLQGSVDRVDEKEFLLDPHRWCRAVAQHAVPFDGLLQDLSAELHPPAIPDRTCDKRCITEHRPPDRSGKLHRRLTCGSVGLMIPPVH